MCNSSSQNRVGYRSRYDRFWKTISWRLPDSVLASIWNVDRRNLRARRVRIQEMPPRWRLHEDENQPVFKAAVQLEKLKAKMFTGAKPANVNGPNVSKNKIAAEISLEIIKWQDDGRILLDLHFRLLGAVSKHLEADIESDEDLAHPRIIASSDTFSLSPDDHKVFALAAYNHMHRYFGDGPTGGVVKWARWVEIDLTRWIRKTLHQSAAGRIIQVLSSQMSPSPSGIVKAFTESLEV